MSDANFDYDLAFDRNIGWVTAEEQQALRRKRIAIAGMGGVGGVHLLTLARMGIGAFNISDLDTFELANFNRQAGATLSSLGRPKVEVMAEMARDINPTLDIKTFGEGVRDGNIDAFLEGVDLFVDGFDFFVPDIRAKVFRRCSELGIPAITAGPIGFGTSYIVFLPGRMTFEEYFRLEDQPREQQYARFLLGLTPKGLHREYLVDPSRLNLVERRGPSSAAAVQLCAGAVGGEAVKILLERGRVRAAPWYHQFDVYRGRFVAGRLWLGNNNPLQRLKLGVVAKHIATTLALARAQASELAEDARDIEKILELARWAPSGDNSQPWRFEIRDDDRVVVHIHDQSDDDIYDYNGGQPSLLSAGMLLETMRIAASRYGRRMIWQYAGSEGRHHRIEVQLLPAPGLQADPLAPSILARSVDRRPFRTTPLSAQQRDTLSASLGEEFEVRWLESRAERWRITRLNGQATDIRLRIPEAFRVHQRILDWSRDLSPEGVPSSAIGLDSMTLKIMRWAIKDWRRMDRLNRLPGSTFAARLQMDYLPGHGSAAFFAVSWRHRPQPADRIPALLRAGAAWQRFWLTATSLGLASQPAMATVIFAHYGRHQAAFTADSGIRAQAAPLAQGVDGLGLGGDDLLFMGRVGRPKRGPKTARSVRRPIAQLRQEPGTVRPPEAASAHR
jgi:molybdopterin/thiamine biosynthesis adenylyltransferase/nitroreductase